MLTHKGTVTLTTPRLTLRRFELSDAPGMFENYCNDEVVCRYVTWEPHEKLENTEKLVETWLPRYDDPSFYNWVIIYEGKPVGSIGVVHTDNDSEWAELGYCLGRAYWNKGLMTEACNAVIDFLFSEVNLNRICLCHAVLNPASGKVAQKCGMTEEGTRRQEYKKRGSFLDLTYYGILKSDRKKD